METETYASFDQSEIQATLEAVRGQYDAAALSVSADEAMPTASADLEIAAAHCISVSVGNGRVCLNLPLGLGRSCIPVPGFVPDGTAVRACIKVRTTWGIPRGVRITLEVGGEEIASQYFGI